MSGPSKSEVISADFITFINDVSRRNFQITTELTKIGISLLKNFPATRDAVLDYFAMVFHDAVNALINQPDYEPESNQAPSVECVGLIGAELCALGEHWAPFIAPWCIKLLMDIATEKANLPNLTLQNLDPVRVLLDITAQNLTLLDQDERAKCIDMMLGSRACSWAVGAVGRAEPALVAPRALTLPPDAARAVFAHLGAHPPALLHVRAALQAMFNEAISDNASPEKKRDVIPYLLTLASKSDIVLKALTHDIENTLTDAVFDRICALCASQRGCPAWEPCTADALVALLIRADVQCFLKLLDLAGRNVFCRQLTEHLLQQLESEAMSRRELGVLESAADAGDAVRARMLDGPRLVRYSVARLLILLGYTIPAEHAATISYALRHARSDAALALLARCVSGVAAMHAPADTPDVELDGERYQTTVTMGVQYGLRQALISDTQIKRIFVEDDVPPDLKTYLHHYCLNVVTLLRWENSGRAACLRARPFARALEASAARVAAALAERCGLRARPACTMAALPEMPTCHALAALLDKIDMSGAKSHPPSVETILKVIKAIVKYFFRCLHEKDLMTKLRGCATASRVLRKLCGGSKLARAVALRSLLETAVLREEQAFGGRAPEPPVADPRDGMLMHMNQKHGPITQLTQSHTSVFHAGVIGRGVRQRETSAPDAPPVITTNNELLMGALTACMDCNTAVEGATSIALLLVELVAPDVMYNGLPWPDEDFTKQVSIERELYMRARLERSPAARAALRVCARTRPALCLASSLLRCVAASALHRAAASDDRQSHSTEMCRERASLQELLALMTLGQLLPPPLSHMLELTPTLTAHELVQVLRDCLWNYMRDNVPSPALFNCDATGLHWRDPATYKAPSNYTDTLRIIIQKRIAKLGHLYPIMFLNLEKGNHNLVYMKST